MIAAPLVVVWLCSQVLYFKLPVIGALVLSIALSYACAEVASRIWERRSRTAEISFSELMIWSWYRLQRAEHKIQRSLRKSDRAESHGERLQVLHELAAALESKDPYTRGHSKRVERHSFKTGVAMGLALDDVEALRMSASLHDVGKIRVPNKVLHKAGALDPEERALIQEHPELGAQMVASLGDEQVVEAVRHHHERWDGGGYPGGKAGTDIPLFGRVIAVADSYDAIRSTRSYRAGASRDEAVQVLKDESGHQFDPDVVEAFLSTLPARGRAVAALTSLATGPGALWRYLAQLFQRFGSTALAPVIGAAGTAVIVGTSSLLSPPAPAVASPMGDIPVAVVTSGAAGSTAALEMSGAITRQGLLARALAARQELAAEARADRRSADARADRRAAAVRRERRAARASGDRTGSTPTSGTDEPISSAPTSTTGGGGAAPAGTDSAGTDSGSTTQGTDGDPNGEGKDCKSGERQQGKGYDLHCG